MGVAMSLLMAVATLISPEKKERAPVADLTPPPSTLKTAFPQLQPPSSVSHPSPGLETSGTADLLVWLGGRLAASASVEEILAALESIAQSRPALALELAQSVGRTEEEKAGWVTQVMKGWAGREPDSAWQWLTQQPADRLDEFANGSLLRVVCDVIAVRDPKRLLENIDALWRQDEMAGNIAPLVGIHVGFEALCAGGNVSLAQATLEEWTQSPAAKEIGAAAYETVARQLAETSAEEAAVWLKSLPTSEDRNAAMATFTSEWAERDPIAALQWAESLAPQAGRPEALERTFGDWVERSSADAGEWLGDYLARTEASPEADPLISNLIGRSPAMRSHPDVALRWTALVANPEKRERIEESVLLRWNRREPGAAAHYVWNTPTLPTDRKQTLVQKLSSQPVSTDALADLSDD